MKEIVAATNNKGKIEEFYKILKGYKILTLKEINCSIEVEEDQDSFEGNSRKKAEEISKATNMPCIADDSGLCIEAFDGWPGVYSARFLEDTPQEQKNQAILEKMKDLKGDQRKAKFVCVVTYCENGKCISARGEVEGKIALDPKGENGFGYDPIFHFEGGERSFAEFTPEEKNAVSHRGKAVAQFVEFIKS